MKKIFLLSLVSLLTMNVGAQQKVTLNAGTMTLDSFQGKYFKATTLVISEDFGLPLEGELTLSSDLFMLALGDGNGTADELHVYQVMAKTSKYKWSVSDMNKPDKGGYIQLFPEHTSKNPSEVKIKISAGGTNNTYILENKIYNKIILKRP